MACTVRPPTTRRITAVIPSTKKATSRIWNAGVETGENMFGVAARSTAVAAAAIAERPSPISPAEAARVDTRELYRVWRKSAIAGRARRGRPSVLCYKSPSAARPLDPEGDETVTDATRPRAAAIDRLPADVFAAFAQLASTDLCDVVDLSCVVRYAIRPLWPGVPRIAGPAFTVRTAKHDNLMFHASIYLAQR